MDFNIILKDSKLLLEEYTNYNKENVKNFKLEMQTKYKYLYDNNKYIFDLCFDKTMNNNTLTYIITSYQEISEDINSSTLTDEEKSFKTGLLMFKKFILPTMKRT